MTKLILLLTLLAGVAGADTLRIVDDGVYWINPPELQSELDELREEIAELRAELEELRSKAIVFGVETVPVNTGNCIANADGISCWGTSP